MRRLRRKSQARLAIVVALLQVPLALGSVSPPPPAPSAKTIPTCRASSPVLLREKDTIEKFSKDVETVLHVLKASEYGSDPNIPDVYRNPIYDREEWWHRHISRTRYIRYLVDFPFKSRLLKRTLPQLSVFLLWSCLAIAMSTRDKYVAKLHIGLTPMSLVSAFVASLLTLRGNQGLSRLRDARQVIGQVCLQTREMAQLIAISIYPKDPELGLLAARHVTIFCWSLKAHLQGTSVDDIISTMLPNPSDAFYITNYKRKPPVAILLRLRQIFSHMADQGQLETTYLKELFKTSYRLNEALMVAERVRISPIPPLYTTHTTRLLLFYLFWLPLALHGTLQNGPATLLVTAAVGYAMLGLDEISHILELPFCFMPLRQLSKLSMIESADTLVYQPPPPLQFGGEDSHEDDGAPTTVNQNPPYWYREQKVSEVEKERIRKYD